MIEQLLQQLQTSISHSLTFHKSKICSVKIESNSLPPIMSLLETYTKNLIQQIREFNNQCLKGIFASQILEPRSYLDFMMKEEQYYQKCELNNFNHSKVAHKQIRNIQKQIKTLNRNIKEGIASTNSNQYQQTLIKIPENQYEMPIKTIGSFQSQSRQFYTERFSKNNMYGIISNPEEFYSYLYTYEDSTLKIKAQIKPTLSYDCNSIYRIEFLNMLCLVHDSCRKIYQIQKGQLKFIKQIKIEKKDGLNLKNNLIYTINDNKLQIVKLYTNELIQEIELPYLQDDENIQKTQYYLYYDHEKNKLAVFYNSNQFIYSLFPSGKVKAEIWKNKIEIECLHPEYEENLKFYCKIIDDEIIVFQYTSGHDSDQCNTYYFKAYNFQNLRELVNCTYKSSSYSAMDTITYSKEINYLMLGNAGILKVFIKLDDNRGNIVQYTSNYDNIAKIIENYSLVIDEEDQESRQCVKFEDFSSFIENNTKDYLGYY